MWWTLIKWGSLLLLGLVVLSMFTYILGQQYITDKLNSKIEGKARSTSDIVLQQAVPATASSTEAESTLEMGYISDDE